MKKITLIIPLILSALINAQTIVVMDKKTNEPIQNVSVTQIKSGSKTTYKIGLTDEFGAIQLKKINDEDSFLFEHKNYLPISLTFRELILNNNTIELERVLTLNQIVVSANKWNQPTEEISTKISKINKKEIVLQNPQTAADLLNVSGEVFVQKSQQGGGSPMIRGFSTNRLLYTIDGVRMNTAIFRSGNIQNVISLDPFSIQNTEILFGPGSVIYGSDAIGGVMNFHTLKPRFSMNDTPLIKGNFNMRFSNANSEKTYHFDVNVGWKKFASISSISFNQFGDLRMGANNGPKEYLKTFYIQRIDSIDRIVENENPLIQKPSGYNQINMMQKFRYKPVKEYEIEYGFHYSETSEYSRYDRLIEMNKNIPVSAIWNYGPQKWMMNLLTIEYNKGKLLYSEFKFKVAHQYFEESRINRNFSGGNKNRLRTQTEKVDAISMNFDFVKKYKKHQLFYGTEIVGNKVTSSGEAVNIKTLAAIPTPSRYPNSTWNSSAIYLSYEYKQSNKLTLNAGIRYNQVLLNSDFTQNLTFYPFNFNELELKNDQLNGNFGLVYTPNKKLKLSTNLSNGFRAPNVDDIGKLFDFTNNDVVVPNTKLSPEKAQNIEFNISKIFGEMIKIDITGFYTVLNDAMVRRETKVNGNDSILFDGMMRKAFSIQNAAKATVFGANLGLEFKLGKGFTIETKYNIQKGEEEMDNGITSPARHAAPAFGVTRFTYNKNKLTWQIYSQYSAEVSHSNLNEEEKQKPFIYAKDLNGLPYSPKWMTLNFKAMYQISNNFSINAGIENITDKRYRPYSSGLVAPGRNLIFSIKGVF